MRSSNFSYEEMISRNRGIIRNQDCLKNATIAIAGCGAEGGSAALALARMGACNLILAEPDSFDISNLNRQHGSDIGAVGRNKAEVLAELIAAINPTCKVTVYKEGVTKENLRRFVAEADIVVDAIDYFMPSLTVLLYQQARVRGIPVVTAVSVAWGSYLFSFEPDGLTFEEYVGLEKDIDADKAEGYQYPLLAFCPEPPLYLGKKLLSDAISGNIDVPVIAPAVNFTGGLLASFVYFILSDEKNIVPVPYYYKVQDMFTLKPTKVSWIKRTLFRILA